MREIIIALIGISGVVVGALLQHFFEIRKAKIQLKKDYLFLLAQKAEIVIRGIYALKQRVDECDRIITEWKKEVITEIPHLDDKLFLEERVFLPAYIMVYFSKINISKYSAGINDVNFIDSTYKKLYEQQNLSDQDIEECKKRFESVSANFISFENDIIEQLNELQKQS